MVWNIDGDGGQLGAVSIPVSRFSIGGTVKGKMLLRGEKERERESVASDGERDERGDVSREAWSRGQRDDDP